MIAFHKEVMEKISRGSSQPQLSQFVDRISQAVGEIITFASQHPHKLPYAARDFAFSLARTYMGE